MNQIQSKKKDILKTGSRDIGVNWFFFLKWSLVKKVENIAKKIV